MADETPFVRRPKRLVDVAFAELIRFQEPAVRLHPRGGVDVVRLRFADERVQHRPRKMTFSSESFETGDQSVFMRTVKWIARLESDGAAPTFLAEELSHLARSLHVLSE